MPYINPNKVSLLMSLYLVNDSYDHNPDPLTISATTLLKPTKEIVLAASNKVVKDIDVSTFATNRAGTAIHDSVENAWVKWYKKNLAKLGYDEEFISRIVINPENTEDLKSNDIPVYFEKRSSKKIGKWNVSGKFDNVFWGILSDIKSTSTFTYVNKTNDKDYSMQGGIYKWLNPKIITEDFINIEYYFGDWKPYEAARNPKYPPNKIMTYPVKLPSESEVVTYIEQKLADIEEGMRSPKLIKDCTEEELWKAEDVVKYYKNPAKTDRSTKNYKTYHEALARFDEDGGVGKVVHIKGLAKKCKYCSALGNCSQAEELIKHNLVKLD